MYTWHSYLLKISKDSERFRARCFWGISKNSYNFSEEIIRVPKDSKICRGNFPMRSQEEIFISDFRGHSLFGILDGTFGVLNGVFGIWYVLYFGWCRLHI